MPNAFNIMYEQGNIGYYQSQLLENKIHAGTMG